MTLLHQPIPAVLLAALAFTGTASAQPGATPPGSVPPGPPPGPPPSPSQYGPAPTYGQQPLPPPPTQKRARSGFNLGISLGIGSMESSLGDFECRGCEDQPPPTLAFDFHLGTMIMPRLALQAEVWAHSRFLDSNGESSISQQLYLIAAQYWVSPRFWIKGGLGLASLSVSYNDGFEDVSDPLGEGGGVMGALGYEITSSRSFAFDVQLKAGLGAYEDRDEEITAGTIALGINWY